MLNLRILVAVTMLLILAAGAEEQDVLIDLSRGIGPITFDMLENEVRALGPISEHYYFYHGKAWGDTSVWPEDPFNRVKAVFSDPPDDRPAYIVVSGYGSRYVLPNGIRLGSSLQEVEKLNGRPFFLRGMAQDDAGEVLGWRGGNLERSLPGVKLFFRPLQDLGDGLSEEELNKVCAPLVSSDDHIWRRVYVETGKIQIGRPEVPFPAAGPEYGPAEEVLPVAPPASVAAAHTHQLWYPFLNGNDAVLLETSLEGEDYDRRTTAALYRTSDEGEYKLVYQRDLGMLWEPGAPLTLMSTQAGPEAGLFLAETGSVLTAAYLSAEDESPKVYSLALIRGDLDSPVYKLGRNSRNRPEIRQVWTFQGGQPGPGPVDYTWNGETFCFPDGSRVSQ